MPLKLKVNNAVSTVDVPPDTPLLWVLRDILGVTESRACQIHTKAVGHLRQRLRGLMV